ncbi:hypothetical protein V473_08950 [Sphingobium cupriresistens LL01]|uniref:Uncharacterized protein n=1 Tax=Sphingobium cupriresistens LL01 TaxID=1420583 RepID=A0A0J7Y609_9SPHN|nr:hypothetical protein V473_08950 [Sphingobium cupriresistens LL01]
MACLETQLIVIQARSIMLDGWDSESDVKLKSTWFAHGPSRSSLVV